MRHLPYLRGGIEYQKLIFVEFMLNTIPSGMR